MHRVEVLAQQGKGRNAVGFGERVLRQVEAPTASSFSMAVALVRTSERRSVEAMLTAFSTCPKDGSPWCGLGGK